MKKTLFVVVLICLFMFTKNVSAKEIYYTNNNGVEFTYEEYDFLTRMYWDECQDLMDLEQYDAFIESNIMYGEFDSKSITFQDIMPRGTIISNNNRTLKISKSCSDDCFIAVSHTWHGTPAVKGYDVMGAYLENTQLLTNPSTSVSSTAGISYPNALQKLTNGFGVSLMLPENGVSPVIGQTFSVTKGGHVYASYQHAMSSISLANSKNYTMSKAGYGGVFKFSGTAVNVYDRFSGVDIAV